MMKTVTIHVFDKQSSGVYSETILVSDNAIGKRPAIKATKKRIKERLDEIFANVPFKNWYYEAMTMDDLTKKELKIFEELDVEVV